MLVALKMVSISTDLADHMFQTSVGGEHTVGTLRAEILRHREKSRGGKVKTQRRKFINMERNRLKIELTAVYHHYMYMLFSSR